ncbi:MAG: DeoR/GlpR family DNA-binding transcription regulator [Pleomorphochaeta sp.]|jgi:DeoR family fructose operon transcriptional repressor
MLPVERQRYIQELAMKKKSVSVSELASDLDVSELTIRRDLDGLCSRGVLERTHGGATLRRNLNIEPDYLQKASECSKEKQAVGKLAASLLDEGDTVYINSGSTTLEVIKSILERNIDITIVTNNIDAMWLCKSDGNVKIIFVGGYYRPKSHSVSGRLAFNLIDQIYANKAIIGVDGFSPIAGLTTPVLEEADTTRAMINHSVGSKIVVATENKIGVVSNFKTVPIERVDVLVTDENGGNLLKNTEISKHIQVLIAKS